MLVAVVVPLILFCDLDKNMLLDSFCSLSSFPIVGLWFETHILWVPGLAWPDSHVGAQTATPGANFGCNQRSFMPVQNFPASLLGIPVPMFNMFRFRFRFRFRWGYILFGRVFQPNWAVPNAL